MYNIFKKSIIYICVPNKYVSIMILQMLYVPLCVSFQTNPVGAVGVPSGACKSRRL